MPNQERKLKAGTHNTDKSQLYLDNYIRHFKELAGREVRLLELGIDKGGSLEMWRDYFERGLVAGLDINQVSLDDPSGRIKIYKGDQTDTDLLNRIGKENGPFDIIIDDASHVGSLTKISFEGLFDRWLKPGGIYIIEDWRTGYWSAWPDGAKYKEPKKDIFNKHKMTSHDSGMVGFIKQLVDELGMDGITNPDRGGPGPQRPPKFSMLEVCPGQVFITKATDRDDALIRAQWGKE